MGVVHMVRAALPAMIARRDGWIANLSSAAGLKGVFGYAAYSASKFAVVGYSEALRSELVRHNIGVTVICPPDTRTPRLQQPASRGIPTEDRPASRPATWARRPVPRTSAPRQ